MTGKINESSKNDFTGMSKFYDIFNEFMMQNLLLKTAKYVMFSLPKVETPQV